MSKQRKIRKKRIRRYRPPDPNALLFTRKQTTRALGTSTPTLYKLEEAGKLHPVRLVTNGQVYYRAAEVQALADEGGA